MSFPRYPKYKDSGVEWLGQVPEHWETSRLKNHLARNDGGVWGDDPVGSGGTIVLRSTEQTVDGRWQIEEPALRTLSESDVSAALLTEGDLLLTKSSGSSFHIGKTCLVDANVASMKCCYSNFMQRLRTKSSFTPKLAWYVLNNDLARLQFDLLSNSTTGLANLNATVIGQIALPIPPLSEQAPIAAFLDRETAKIDALIAEQQRLIELLKEKRQAVISHAVTKGMNPDAPMKDSGIEWLGGVPEHWKVTRLSRYAVVGNGSTPSRENEDYWRDGDIPWLSSGEVNQLHVTEASEFITAKAIEECSLAMLPEGAVLVGMVGQGKTRGLSALLRIKAAINQNLAGIVPHSLLVPEYLHFVFQAMYEYLREYGRGGNQAALNCDILSAAIIPLPPLDEQNVICTRLYCACNQQDLLLAQTRQAITLLQERRSALISAAVTGQIDVRGLAGSEAA